MSLLSPSLAFQPLFQGCLSSCTRAKMSPSSLQDQDIEPQVLATGYSQAINMKEAIEEATDMALEALPKAISDSSKIDLAIISVSSLYDGNASPSEVVPTVLKAASSYGKGIQHLVGSTSGGLVSSMANSNNEPVAKAKSSVGEKKDKISSEEKEDIVRSCVPIECEGVPAVSVTLCILPDVQVKVRGYSFLYLTLFDPKISHLSYIFLKFLPLDFPRSGRRCT